MAEMDAILRDLQNSSDPWKHIFHPLGQALANHSNPPPDTVAAANPPSPYEVVELAPIPAATTRTSQRIASKRISDGPSADVSAPPTLHSPCHYDLPKPPTRKPAFDELPPEHQAIDRSLRLDYGYKSSDPPKRPSSPLSGCRTPSGAVATSSGRSGDASLRDGRAAKRSAAAAAAAIDEDTHSLADSEADTPSKRKKRDYKRLTAEQIKNMTPEERKIYEAKRAKNRAAVDKTREKKEKEEADRIKKERDEKMAIERENQLLRSTMAKLIESAIKIERQHGRLIYNHEAIMDKEEKVLYRKIRAQVEKNIAH